MNFLHYSDIPLTGIFDRKQIEGYSLKPIGLWVSDEDDYGWSKWCESQAPDYLAEVVHSVELEPDANILWLKTVEDIDAFTFVYRLRAEWLGAMGDSDYVMAIDWNQLAKEYDGIIITPYQMTRRWTFCGAAWYSPWDCASGCIWKAKAIKHVEALQSSFQSQTLTHAT